jgi:predicted RNA-binding Zn ribbon-like protein
MKTTSNRFRFPSERLGLDFLATLGARGTAEKNEKLRSAADLVVWFKEAGVIDGASIELGDADVAAARRLREAIYRLARARAFADSAAVVQEDVDVVNQAAAWSSPAPRLTPDASAVERIAPASQDAFAAACLGGVARDAIEILGSPLVNRIKSCANPDCQALYLDLSRPNNRRWCSMGDGGCGNRAKTNALRDRRRADSD